MGVNPPPLRPSSRSHDGSGVRDVMPEPGTVSNGAQPPVVWAVRGGRQPRRAEGVTTTLHHMQEMRQALSGRPPPPGATDGAEATEVGERDWAA